MNTLKVDNVKAILNNVIPEFGYRVDAIELPQERGGSEVYSTFYTNTNHMNMQELISLTVDTNTSSLDAVTSQPKKKTT